MTKVELKKAISEQILAASVHNCCYIDDVVDAMDLEKIAELLHPSMSCALAGHVLKASGQVLVEIANEAVKKGFYKSNVDDSFEMATFTVGVLNRGNN